MESQKRTASDRDNLLEGVQTILLDIEGTTTPISFVKDTLFPHVKENLQVYLDSHWEDEECKGDVALLREQANKDKEDNVEGLLEIDGEDKPKEDVIKSVINNVLWQMDNDRKTKGLKQLQGHVWREAYKTGKLQGKVFDDVVPAINSWTSNGKKVYIFSSGSVEAQKLLFGHSNQGDLREKFSGYFDSEVGSKIEKESYAKIMKQVETSPDACLFLTDLAAEAKAAAGAGLNVCIVLRDGNAALTDEEQQCFNSISSFCEIQEDCAAGGEGKVAKTDAVDSTNGEVSNKGEGDAPQDAPQVAAQ